MICPLCGGNLELKQINFTNAVFICMDLKCPYPVDTECIQVERSYRDMKGPSQKTTKTQQHRSAQDNITVNSNSVVNEIENLYLQKMSQSNQITDSSSKEPYHDEINIVQSVQNTNLNQSNFDITDVEDMDAFINELLK